MPVVNQQSRWGAFGGIRRTGHALGMVPRVGRSLPQGDKPVQVFATPPSQTAKLTPRYVPVTAKTPAYVTPAPPPISSLPRPAPKAATIPVAVSAPTRPVPAPTTSQVFGRGLEPMSIPTGAGKLRPPGAVTARPAPQGVATNVLLAPPGWAQGQVPMKPGASPAAVRPGAGSRGGFMSPPPPIGYKPGISPALPIDPYVAVPVDLSRAPATEADAARNLGRRRWCPVNTPPGRRWCPVNTPPGFGSSSGDVASGAGGEIQIAPDSGEKPDTSTVQAAAAKKPSKLPWIIGGAVLAGLAVVAAGPKRRKALVGV